MSANKQGDDSNADGIIPFSSVCLSHPRAVRMVAFSFMVCVQGVLRLVPVVLATLLELKAVGAGLHIEGVSRW